MGENVGVGKGEKWEGKFVIETETSDPSTNPKPKPKPKPKMENRGIERESNLHG